MPAFHGHIYYPPLIAAEHVEYVNHVRGRLGNEDRFQSLPVKQTGIFNNPLVLWLL